jgi:hypothetical protein
MGMFLVYTVMPFGLKNAPDDIFARSHRGVQGVHSQVSWRYTLMIGQCLD